MIPVIVQARVGSKRLPGKVLMPWDTKTLLKHVLCTARDSGTLVWLAAPIDPFDDAVAKEWRHVYRGSESDVLSRFVGCINAMPEAPTAIMRVCADRPFLNPDILVAMRMYWYAHPGLDYLAPHDLSCAAEIVSVKALRRADRDAVDQCDREHVTPWILHHPAFKRKVFPLTVDTLEDYEALCPKS